MGFKSNKKNMRNRVKPLEVVSADASKKGDKPKDPTILPNTFKFAADSLKIMSERGGSAGSIVVNNYKSYNYKLIYALVMNAVKNIKIIKKIIHNLKLMKSIQESNPFLLEILIGDLLFGKGLKQVEKNPVAVAINDRKDAILKEKNALKEEFSKDVSEEIAKYLRVNHLKCDTKSVISLLKAAGLSQYKHSGDELKLDTFNKDFETMTDEQFMLDLHFPNDLIVLKPSATKKLASTKLIRQNKATFQDKTSFMAVEALDVKPSQHIIDACFAPGTKTSLIATKMKNKGKILAYDINKSRLVSAVRFLKLQGVTNVHCECVDFSQVKLKRLLKLHKINSFDSILIDPSCSGSGIQSRVDYKKTGTEVGRLKKLQAFQVSLLKHALIANISNSIVYCTCSTSSEENEQVVEMALNESGVKDKWKVVDAIPYWPHRGDPKFEFGEKCLRSDSTNLTNGFFIAKLKRQIDQTHDADSLDQKRPAKKLRLDRKQVEDEKDDSDAKVDEEENDDEEDEDEEIDDDEEDEEEEDEEIDDDEEDEEEEDEETDDEDEDEEDEYKDAKD